MKKLTVLYACGVMLCLNTALLAGITTYNLDVFTQNGDYYDDPALDIYMEVLSADTTSVRFDFYNNSTLDSSAVSHIYFYEDLFQSLRSIENGEGVSFSEGANPSNLPAANLLTEIALDEPSYVISADSPAPFNGINSGQSLGIILDLKAGYTYENVISAFDNRQMFVGARIISLPDGSSEAAAAIPEPATVVLLAIGSFALLRKPKNK
ncbi:MAG: PEP-CTERM sorting domain-containing protein [Planctomycetes bacterium]|nr:PEP-CTERM sorting domain-containing protein [Planctomycetota bacterium]